MKEFVYRPINQAGVPILNRKEQKIISFMGNRKFYIEHIGSTSVERMYVIQIIDILIDRESFPLCDNFIESIIKLVMSLRKKQAFLIDCIL